MTNRTVKNPILPGFHPDPSLCRVANDYFLVTSTFEYFPGLPIYHSHNLVDWTLIGHGINQPEQLRLSQKLPNAFGLYAPTIRHINNRFYIVCTNVGDNGAEEGNFLIWTDDIYGSWSQPIWLNTPGIDPTIFEDEDGQCYYLGTHKEIYLRKIDLTNGKLGERQNIWTGSGAADPEGPHLYKKDGFYYLLISEGGTSYGHMLTMARSRNLEGPYEPCPMNPVLTNRSTNLPLQATGHADMVQDTTGKWWAVCLAVRPISYPLRHLLGRETCLMSVDWSADWPIFGDAGQLPELVEVDFEATEPIPKQTDWVTLFNWNTELIEAVEDGFVFHPNKYGLSDQEKMAVVFQRQQAHEQHFQADFDCQQLTSGEAGLTVFLNPTHHYEIALEKNITASRIILRRQIGSLWKVEAAIPYAHEKVQLIIEGDKQAYHFSYLDESGKHRLGSGETSYLTTEVGGVFTGVMVGVYAVSDKERQQVSIQNFQ